MLEMQLCRDLAQNGGFDVGEVVSWELLPEDLYFSLSGRRGKLSDAKLTASIE